MGVEIAMQPALRVGIVRGDLGYAQQTWERFGAVAGPAGLIGKPGVATAAILAVEAIRVDGITGPARPNEVRYDAAVVLRDGELLTAGLTEDIVPAGRYAHAVHEGGYEGLAPPGAASPASGCRRAGSGSATASATRCTGARQNRRRTQRCAPTSTSPSRSQGGRSDRQS